MIKPGNMSTDEKIRLGIASLTVVSSVVVAAHFGHIHEIKLPILEELGGMGSH